MIRVFVVARSEVVRAGLVSLLEHDSNHSVSIAGSSSHRDIAVRGDADVILVDSDERLPEVEGEGEPGDSVPVVLLTDDAPMTALQDGTRGGVRAVLPRNASAAEILAAVSAAAAGLVAVPAVAWMSTSVSRRAFPATGSSPREELTARELQVLRMLAEGHSNKTIAWQLGISEHTVKFHISSIFAKLDAGSRTEAVAVGVRLGLIML